MLRIDARSSRELQAVILAVKAVPRDLQNEISRQTKRITQAEWTKALAEQAETRLEHRVLVDTGRSRPSSQNIQLSSAKVGRPLSGGLAPKTDFAAVEFGGNRDKFTEYKSRRGSTSFKVRRRTMRQLRPRRRNGYVFYPAANRMIPRIFSLWAQTTVRSIAEALEGKRG